MNFDDISNVLQLNLPSLPDNPLPAGVVSLLIFVGFVLLSLIVGRYTPGVVWLVVHRFSPHQVSDIYDNLIEPLKTQLRWAGTLTLISLSMVWIESSYPGLHGFLKPFIDLGVIVSVAWLASRIFRQVVRIYGIDLLRRLGREVDELLLVVETLANVAIGLIAVLAFAQSQEFNLVGLIASLGIGGIAIAFAAQKILEQLLSTVVLYLDRPFIPGEYIRIGDGDLGRIESIGLRSTKIRTAAKSTLLIVPNSTLISMDIENVTRAKKVMVMLYLDFSRSLTEQDSALVKQVVARSTDSLFGIDPGSTNITITDNHDRRTSRARVTFFILGSSENSIQLRKRLLELANDTISHKLLEYGIEFEMQSPTIYVESPVTI